MLQVLCSINKPRKTTLKNICENVEIISQIYIQKVH